MSVNQPQPSDNLYIQPYTPLMPQITLADTQTALWSALVHIAYIYIFLLACSIVGCVYATAEVAWDYYEYGVCTRPPADAPARRKADRCI